jgi:hypothetical protein
MNYVNLISVWYSSYRAKILIRSHYVLTQIIYSIIIIFVPIKSLIKAMDPGLLRAEHVIIGTRR